MESWGSYLFGALMVLAMAKGCSDQNEREDRLQRIEAQLERHERILWKQY